MSELRSSVVERTYRAGIEELWGLWTTKEGFESWWGPEGFRVEVHALEARTGGALNYEMLADTPEMIEAMRQMGRPASHASHARFAEYQPGERLMLTHAVDFLPGVAPYESRIGVAFQPAGGQTRMVVTIHPMHDEAFTRMTLEGFSSQLNKLDRRYGQQA